MLYYNTKQQKLMMAIDWLQWSGYLIGAGKNDLPELECPDTYRLEVLDGNQVFKYRAVLYDCLGNKCITMMWKPKSPLIQYNLVTFQVANMWFYRSEDVKRIIDLAARCFIYQFATMTRIDICCDFELKRKQKQIVKGLFHHKIYCGNKRNGTIWWSKDDDNIFPHDFGFGSVHTSVKWKLYNKSKELKAGEEVEEKPYIIDRWLENGMDKYHIWRLEVSINDFNKFFIKANPILTGLRRIKKEMVVQYTGKAMTLEDINDMTIYGIFCDLYENRFQLRKKQNHTRVCNDERVYIIDLEKHEWVVPAVKEESNHIDNSVMHHLISVIESDGAKQNYKLLDAACDALLYYVKFNRLDGLFKATKDKELNDYINEMRDLVGSGIIDYLDPYKDD